MPFRAIQNAADTGEGAKAVPTAGASTRQGQVEEPDGHAVPGMIDLITIQRAYAANLDALRALNSADIDADAVGDRAGPRASTDVAMLTLMVGALQQELRLIEDLRQALPRQRAGVAADDAEAVENSVYSIGRTLITLKEARRGRRTLMALVAGRSGMPLAGLEEHLGVLPAGLVAAREGVSRGAAAAARDVAMNQAVLREALEAGDAFLQQLFSEPADPLNNVGNA